MINTLKIAIPNKGALAASTSEIIQAAGYRTRSNHKSLSVIDKENQIEFFFLRPKDIAIYVANGDVDLGITGRDLIKESQVNVYELLALGYGNSKFCYAGLAKANSTIANLSGSTIASAYPNIVKTDLRERQINATVINLDGAVEISIALGVADFIADVVSSGQTLREHGLAIIGEPILISEAVIVARQNIQIGVAINQFVRRLQGLVYANNYVMVDYHCPKNLVVTATTLTPGLESPTVSQLADNNWVAIRALVKKSEANQKMDMLADLGVKAIIMTEIKSCRI